MPFIHGKIREVRGKRTQENFAALVSHISGNPIKREHVSNWERGCCKPNESNFDAIRKISGKPTGFFFGETNGRKSAASKSSAKETR